jgi:hypothetical protein
MSRAIRTLYRLFLRQAAVMEKQGISIDVQMPMDKSAWLQNGGGHGWATPAPGNFSIQSFAIATAALQLQLTLPLSFPLFNCTQPT